MILSFWTGRPGQTVQTQSSLIRVYTVCHSICIVWTHYSQVEPHSSNFRVTTTNVLGVRIFRKFTVYPQVDPKDLMRYLEIEKEIQQLEAVNALKNYELKQQAASDVEETCTSIAITLEQLKLQTWVKNFVMNFVKWEFQTTYIKFIFLW